MRDLGALIGGFCVKFRRAHFCDVQNFPRWPKNQNFGEKINFQFFGKIAIKIDLKRAKFAQEAANVADLEDEYAAKMGLNMEMAMPDFQKGCGATLGQKQEQQRKRANWPILGDFYRILAINRLN